MLFADAVLIQVSGADLLGAAGTLSVGLAGGLAGGARVLAWYLSERDKIHAEARVKADAERAAADAKSERRKARAFRRIGDAMGQMTETLTGLTRLVHEIDQRTADHRPLDQHPHPKG
ncbi:MAG TPA: hypothetical protein VD866_08845 [Urbifossiella sp.]|nr:hypothetical protein [Urbifossiella sp.]